MRGTHPNCEFRERRICTWRITAKHGLERRREREKEKEREPVAKRHHMVSGTLALLYTVFGLKLGCSGAATPIGDKVL